MALPHEHPKLAVTAMVDGNNDFAAQLDRAVISKTAKITGQPHGYPQR